LSGTRLEGADLRGAAVEGSSLAVAVLSGARVDVDIALAYAAAMGLRIEFG